MAKHDDDLEVDVHEEGGRAVIEGKTSVQFKKFVGLILQRKVMNLLRDSGDEPVIVSSDLLTNLASAPQDSAENRAQLVAVTLGVGVLCGVFLSAIALVLLLTFEVTLARREYLIIAGGIVGLALLAVILAKIKARRKSQRLVEVMEGVASLLSK